VEVTNYTVGRNVFVEYEVEDDSLRVNRSPNSHWETAYDVHENSVLRMGHKELVSETEGSRQGMHGEY